MQHYFLSPLNYSARQLIDALTLDGLTRDEALLYVIKDTAAPLPYEIWIDLVAPHIKNHIFFDITHCCNCTWPDLHQSGFTPREAVAFFHHYHNILWNEALIAL